MILLPICMLAGGLLLLLFGGEVLLRGAVSLARQLQLSPLLIGMTVVAAATSMPEMVVAVASGLEDAPDIGVGNVVGSNTANILLILGAAAVFSPIVTEPRRILRDGLAMLVATAVFMVLAFSGPMGRLDGFLMLFLLVAYLTYSYQHDRKIQGDAEPDTASDGVQLQVSTPISLLLVGVGVGLLVLGSELLIEGAVDLALIAGISEAVIGLTLVAIGTSLPELATAIVSSLRRHPEVALGNVLGSNIFNVLAIIPALAITTPVQVAAEILAFDIWVMAGVTVVALALLLSGWRLGRCAGAAALLAYAVYLAVLFSRGQVPAA